MNNLGRRHLWPCSSDNQDLKFQKAFLQAPLSSQHNLINCHQSLGSYRSLCSHRWGTMNGAERMRPQTGKGKAWLWPDGGKTSKKLSSILLIQFFLQAFKTIMFCPSKIIGKLFTSHKVFVDRKCGLGFCWNIISVSKRRKFCHVQ